LVLYDLGYFDLERFADWNRRGVRWISRGLSHLTFTLDGRSRDLIDWLAAQRGRRIDRAVLIGAKRLPCRLIAIRVPKAVAKRRRQAAIKKAAKKKGRRPSRHHLASCAWVIYLTNCPASQLASHEVEVLYRLRWQIELLFKLWKSHHHLADHRRTDPVRQMIELLARLIAVLVQHWLLLTSGWDDPQLSLVKATRLIRERMPLLIEALAERPRLEAVLQRLVEAISHRCRLNTRRGRPNAAQLLQKPELQKDRSLT
jgi:IS4 transposase